MKSNLLLYMRVIGLTFVILTLNFSNIYASGAFPLDNPSDLLIGMNQKYSAEGGETLIELARTYDVGYNEIIAANRTIDPWMPEKGAEILVPTSWLVPEILEEGIVINLSEMRLYYFPTINRRQYVITYPIGIGREGMSTPTGIFEITSKVKDPVWRVPKSMRKENPELPLFIPPGPDNPLGGYWLQLSPNGYGLHGTNRPYAIGRRVSHGCIRLYPEDMETLHRLIKPGARVKIIDEPVKAGLYENKVYIEVHSSDRTEQDLLKLATEKLSGKRLIRRVKTQTLIESIMSATGLPTVVSQ